MMTADEKETTGRNLQLASGAPYRRTVLLLYHTELIINNFLV
jgi:hypothetical protein